MKLPLDNRVCINNRESKKFRIVADNDVGNTGVFDRMRGRPEVIAQYLRQLGVRQD